MRRILALTVAILAAVSAFLILTLPPRPAAVTWTGNPDLARRTVAGAYHIHSTKSDGAADVDTIAAAAARAGLQFIILTDHGDGTRTPAPPAYIHDVLWVEGVEISTSGGHYVALGMPATPYPLGGEPAAVVEDVARFGGFGIAAHVDSPKAELAWTDWSVPIDGVEWLNADSEWRNEGRVRLARVLFDYALRPGPAMASMLDRPSGTLVRWDSLTARRPVVAIAGHDAHGGIGQRAEERLQWAIPGVPSYEASFRAFGVRAVLDAPLSGQADADSRRLLDAVRHGRLFTVIDAVASPAFLDFHAEQERGTSSANTAQMGGVMRPGSGALSVTASMPAGGQLVLLHDGRELKATGRPDSDMNLEGAVGAFRVEVRVPGAPGNPPVPWLVSNPIYFLPPAVQPPAAAEPSVSPFPPDVAWRVEKDPASSGSLSATGVEVTLEFRLKPGDRANQFVALAADVPGRMEPFDLLTFDARASRPMRVSAQLRYPSGGGERWARSFFAGPQSTPVTIRVREMLPADHQTGSAPATPRAGALLFVVDLTNALPGDSGTLEISHLQSGR